MTNLNGFETICFIQLIIIAVLVVKRIRANRELDHAIEVYYGLPKDEDGLLYKIKYWFTHTSL